MPIKRYSQIAKVTLMRDFTSPHLITESLNINVIGHGKRGTLRRTPLFFTRTPPFFLYTYTPQERFSSFLLGLNIQLPKVNFHTNILLLSKINITIMTLVPSSEEDVFTSIESLVTAANKYAGLEGYAVVIARIKVNKKGKKRKAWPRCDREEKSKEPSE